nr:ABC transporter permease [Desulfonema limicola]
MICCCLFITIFYSFLSILFPLSNRLFKVLNFLFISTPSFFSGLIVALIAVRYLPFFSFSGSFESVSDYIFFLPPAFVLSLYPMAILSKILANEMEEILKKPYILAARAYAFNEKKICYIYALKNAVIPYLAAISNQLPMLFTGAFIVEIIFSVPGIGSLLIKSVLERDFPMLEAIIILNGIIFILTNIFFENLYPLIDPRIRKK